MPLANGQIFAGYKILGLLGSGGMGEVYLAQHPRLPRKVALKVLSADVSANADYRARFAREAELASELDHPNIVVVHDRDEEDGQLWISMQYVDGLDAARLLADKFPDGMPPHHVSKIVTAVASALDYAHNRGLLHRDVKPANIMLTDDEQRVLLTDFGIARSLNGIGSLTAKGFIVATVPYAAPEQLQGQELDGRADQYALAKTAYHLLTGSQLFPHSLAEKPIGHVALDAILATALAEKPGDRFQNCTEFALAFAFAHRGAWAVSSTGTLHPIRNAASGPRQASDRATRQMASEVPAQDSAQKAPRLRGGSRKLGLVVAAAVLGLMAVPVVALVLSVRPWQHHESPTTGTPTSVAPSMTFDAMRDFVTAYYGDLPARPDAAWAKLDDHCKEQTGFTQFTDFWATIQTVTVISVSPRDATSVVARLRYDRRNGQSDTEDRWLKMAFVNGTMLLDESGRVGAAPTATSSLPAPHAGAFPASSIDNLLLTPEAIGRVTGAGPWQVAETASAPTDHSGLVTPYSCVGVIFTAEQSVYADRGLLALRDQTLKAVPPTIYPGKPLPPDTPEQVQQTAIVFPTVQQAQAVLTASQREWQSCAAGQVSYQ
ncbi:serine/threonine-protein kinase PknH/PknJ, partial [uncultured Mycobacterium sp.]|uniref:serine/threonine-protein kinase PknH/PknJ n=1 Tax=uncultured Mycobacterium sp. TaxID=171292 RepID=UPI0035CBFDF4